MTAAGGALPRYVAVMGVSGSGKSTVGAQLARRLGVPFGEGDDFHPAANIAAMRDGRPLRDEERYPWLDSIGRWLSAQPDGAVVSCSALKRAYRDRLRSHCPALTFLHLIVPPGTVATRMAARAEHFMPVALLQSQLETLEPLGPDEPGITIDASGDPDSTVEQYLSRR